MVKPVLISNTLTIALPVIITSFTSHIIVPTISEYLNKDPKALFRVIFYGSLIPLFLYFFWLISILGLLPLYGEISFMNLIFNQTSIQSANVGDILNALSQKIVTKLALISLNIFTDISVMTSYLGVSLALYHFNIDSYNLYRLKSSILKTFISISLTFILPLVINLIKPNLFINAISYVGVCIGILLLAMPAIIAYQLNKKGHKFYYRINRIPLLWLIAFIMGISVVIINFL